MRRVLVGFASHQGQTEKIAHHLARQLEDRGLAVRLVDMIGAARAGESDAGADDCDAAILAGSLHLGRYDAALASFLMRHGPAIGRGPSAFVTVSLSAASEDETERRAVEEIAQRFLYETGWLPEHVLHAAGAIHDRRMNPVERFALHAIADAHGLDRHPSGDTELTDWAALDRFARDFVGEVKARPVASR